MTPDTHRNKHRAAWLLPLLAWLLWVVQVPYHGGMSAADSLPGAISAQDISALGIDCGPRPDATTVFRLIKAGFIEVADIRTDRVAQHKYTLCDLFASLLSPSLLVFPQEIPVVSVAAPPASMAQNFIFLRNILSPPARGPPSVS